jgi:hypothetical protein
MKDSWIALQEVEIPNEDIITLILSAGANANIKNLVGETSRVCISAVEIRATPPCS